MRVYQQLRFYSPITDCDVVRLSMCDDRGREFFTLIPVRNGAKAFRIVKDRALDALMDAMDPLYTPNPQPGEVPYDQRWEAPEEPCERSYSP